MGMQSQISEKIRAMSEPNRKIEEETKEELNLFLLSRIMKR